MDACVEAVDNLRVEDKVPGLKKNHQVRVVFLTKHLIISLLARGPLAARRGAPGFRGPQVENPWYKSVNNC